MSSTWKKTDLAEVRGWVDLNLVRKTFEQILMIDLFAPALKLATREIASLLEGVSISLCTIQVGACHIMCITPRGKKMAPCFN